MAGKILHFTGKVEAVREATEKELTEGLHGEYLPKEGCGNCHKGGCKDGDCGCEGDCGSEDCGCEGDCGCKN
jgi:FKBP-type peptidyl-prolyl cis-trans isomerase SlyD